MIPTLLSLAATAGFAFAQDPAAPPAPQQPAQPQQPAAQQPGPVIQPPQQPPQPPDQSVGKIRDYRGGSEGVKYIRRFEDVLELDFSKVDFEAPVVATIDGEPITNEMVRLWLAFAGGQLQGVRTAQMLRLTEQAVKRATADGADPKRFEVADADVEVKLRSEEEQARAQGEAALVEYKKMVDDTLGQERYRRLVKATMLSEKLLLPPIVKVEGQAPEGLPIEAAELLSDRPDIRDYLNNAYLSQADFPAMFRSQFLMMLQEAQVAKADIKYAVETELPPGVYMTINGEEVPTAEILDFVPNTPDTRDLGLRLLLTYRAIDRELKKADALLSAEQFQLIFEAHEAEYKNTLFPLPNLIRLRGFMSMPEYREYYRRRAAYQQMIEATVDAKDFENALQVHHSKNGKFFYENGKLTLEVVWAGLAEAEAGTNGDLDAAWNKALDKAHSMLVELKGGKPIADVRAALGNTYPVEPTGILAGKTRNELRNHLGENEYTIFVNGYSLADDLFYNREEGEIVGPMRVNRTVIPGLRSRMGFLVAQPVSFSKNSALKSFEQQRAMVEQDYHDLNFAFFAAEALKNSKIELTLKR
jgi:hypothetical protein